MNIRPSKEADLEAIRAMHTDAFGAREGPEIVSLVADLLLDDTARPYLSLVAESANKIAGHVLFTAARIDTADSDPVTRIMAPLGVARDFQGQGVGGLLVREGLRRLNDDGVELVFVLGHPGYYPRFGFSPAGARGLAAPYPILAKNADAWMVQGLQPGVLDRVEGTVRCASALRHPKYWRE